MFEGKLQELSVLRRAIKTQLESVRIGDVSFFKVWIHEDDPYQPGDADSWEKCMEKARDADLVIVLFNGACRSAMERNEFRTRIGICHAEMHEALTRAPSKVWAVMFPAIVYVADGVQKIQMVFITNCRDETTTQHRVQRFLEWLSQEQEDRLLAKRAVSRGKISDLISHESKIIPP